MMFLLGRQAMLGHDPPIYLRSITATRLPSLAKVHAARVEPVPSPRITRSYSSTPVFLRNGAGATSTRVFMCAFLCQTRQNMIWGLAGVKYRDSDTTVSSLNAQRYC